MFITFVRRVSQVVAELAGWLAVPMMLMVFMDAVLRGLMGVAIEGVTEASASLLVAMIYMGLAGTQSVGANFRVTLLTVHMPRWISKLAVGLSYSLFLVCLVLLFWFCLNTAMYSWERGEMSYGLIEVPIWPTRLLIAAGLALLIIQYVVDGFLFLKYGIDPFSERDADMVLKRLKE